MTITLQFYTLTSMIAMGVWLGASFDTYERFMIKPRRFHLLTALRDLLFWVLQALIVFYVLLQMNHGEMRIYIFLALLCGYAAYQALFKKIYQWLLEVVINAMRVLYRFVRAIVRTFVFNPLKWVLHILYRLSMIVISVLYAVLMFVLRVVGAPFLWLAHSIGLTTLLQKLALFYQKVKDFFQRLLKRDREG